jgi:hypothetical protein
LLQQVRQRALNLLADACAAPRLVHVQAHARGDACRRVARDELELGAADFDAEVAALHGGISAAGQGDCTEKSARAGRPE